MRCNYFGDGGGGDDPRQKQLDEAYLRFKSWLQSEKLSCSQPPFRTRHVS